MGKLKDLKKITYFTNKDFKKFLNIKYPSVYINRLKKKNKIKKIAKNKYTLYDDPWIYATHLHFPSYISFLSALEFYNYTTQKPIKITIATIKKERDLKEIKFVKIKKEYFFGYKKIKYKDHDLFIAKKEKLFLDCLLYQNYVQVSDLNLLLKDVEYLDKKLIIKYLKKINNISLIKRAGYLLELVGKDIYDKVKKEVQKNNTYVRLNKNIKKSKKNNTKWKVNINEVIEI